MKNFITYLFLFFCSGRVVAQNDFIGVAKYKLSVSGSDDTNTDSMSIIFDKERVMVILYIPDSNKVAEKIFIDDFSENKSMTVDRAKQAYKVDSLKTNTNYNFVNDYSIGAVNNELCLRYKAKLSDGDKSSVTAAECLAGINFRNSAIKDYFFLGVQPVIVDNRIVMDYTVTQTNGTRPRIVIYDITKMDNVDKYFDLWGYREVK